MSTFPQACTVNKGAVNRQPLAHGADVQGVARQDHIPRASKNGHQSSPELPHSDQGNRSMIPEKAEVREVTKTTPKRGIKEGTVAPNKKTKPEESAATTTKKKKVTKARKVTKAKTVAKAKKAAKAKKVTKAKKCQRQDIIKGQESIEGKKGVKDINGDKVDESEEDQAGKWTLV
ncbi:hypothetical protein H2199_009110 [Coniosporium tulheliwenetii]|uniref:Uncharacterized protein n=1 Tax=Coniosporium tulheliwenetii TaxID=3383036 RepID=A0ACC2YFG7_9PEZI|nr:hypothetical protein H2199_009110 [Cladosporium sp. JES 115]